MKFLKHVRPFDPQETFWLHFEAGELDLIDEALAALQRDLQEHSRKGCQPDMIDFMLAQELRDQLQPIRKELHDALHHL